MQIAYSKHTHTAWKNRLKVEGAPLCTSWFLCRVNWLLSIEIDGSQNQSQQSSAIRYQLGFLSRDYSAKISWPCSAYDHTQQFPSHEQHGLLVWQLLPKRIHIRTVLTNTRVVGCIFPPSADVQELQLIFVLLAYYIAPTSNGDV